MFDTKGHTKFRIEFHVKLFIGLIVSYAEKQSLKCFSLLSEIIQYVLPFEKPYVASPKLLTELRCRLDLFLN
jgi:hypothetical protein